MPILRIISDIHGRYDEYMQLIHNCDYSIQLGDFGLTDPEFLNEVDYTQHKIIFGNHDLWNCKEKYPHFLTKFGQLSIGSFDFFYIAGGKSIDAAWRTPYVDWFPEEEMTYAQGQECIDLYDSVRPKYVLSHECPSLAFLSLVPNPMCMEKSITREIMSQCFAKHHPTMWIFGHHHRTKRFMVESTSFLCLAELNYIDIEV